MDDSSINQSFFSDLHNSLNQQISFSSINPQQLQKLLKEKPKARKYIKNCKNILKKQSDQLKKQQKEFKKAVSTIQTQNFTTKFHAVAFQLQLDVMKLIGFRRVLDTVILKRFFTRYANKAKQFRALNYYQSKFDTSKIKSVCFSVWSLYKKVYHLKLAKGLQEIKAKGKKNGKYQAKLALLMKQKQKLLQEAQVADQGVSVQSLTQENKQLQQRLVHTQQSVSLFIKEMGDLLSRNEALVNEKAPAKRRAKGKHKLPLASPERIELQRKLKNFRVQFD